jgi:hypothetical protein
MNGWTFRSLLVRRRMVAILDLVEAKSMSEIACYQQLRQSGVCPAV